MLRKFFAALFLCVALPASPNTFMTDGSDMWLNPSEPGWGLNVVHHADKMFVTLFVYSSTRQTKWYVAPDMSHVGDASFRGDLYETQGPWFGGPFDPAAVTATRVGEATLRFEAASVAVFSYTIDGVAVSKTVTRHTLKANQLGGTYVGVMVGTYTGCGADGYAEEPVFMQISHAGSAISIQNNFGRETCTYTGNYAQSGRLGAVQARIDCGNGDIGPFVATEIEATTAVIAGRGVAQYASCRWEGSFGVVRTSGEPGSAR